MSKNLIITGFSALVIALPFVLKPYVVTGISMEPTFMDGEYLLVENLSPRLFGLSRSANVVFQDPRDPQHPIIIKRAIGLPHETIRITNDSITVVHPNGTEEVVSEKWLVNTGNNGADMEMKLGPEDYFLMGDHRDQSQDSRSWGTIQPHEMIGRPVLRIWPLSRFSIFP